MKRTPGAWQFYALLPFIAFLFFAGKCNDTGNCRELVQVSDHTGLDGCGILFRTANGKLLLPSNLYLYSTNIADGDTVSVSYKVVRDAVSICMKEDATITLTCLEAYHP